MSYPTPYTVQRKPYVAGAKDAHGNPVDTWGTAVDLPAHAIAPGAMEEPGDPGRDLSLILFTLYCPAGTVADERDRIVLDGTVYDIEGLPKDYTRGPWVNPIAGVVIYLKRAEG